MSAAPIAAAAGLAAAMAAHDPPRDVYLARGGGYYLTYGGGQVYRRAIDEALRLGLIAPKWPDKPDLEFWRLAGGGGGNG